MEFIGLKGYDIEKATNVEILLDKYKKYKTGNLLMRLVKYICVNKYTFEYNCKGGKICFFISESSLRKDDSEGYKKIMECTNSFDTIKCNVYPKVDVLFIKNIILVFLWIIQINRSKKRRSFNEYLLILSNGLRVRQLVHFLRRIDVKKYKCGVVWFDLEALNNIFVQCLKNNRIITITAQHGAVLAPKENIYTFADEGTFIRDSISDIFMAWNRLTYDEAIKSGEDPKKYIILGICRCIGKVRKDKKRTNSFGVLLSGRHEDNHKLIVIANQLAKKRNCKYYVKIHPKMCGNEYDSMINHSYGIKVALDETIEKFSEMIEFSLVINSSAIMELIFYKVNVYVFDTDDYSICDELDKYRFSNIDEIEHLLNENSSQEDLFEYTCYTENPKEKYESFFRNIIS